MGSPKILHRLFYFFSVFGRNGVWNESEGGRLKTSVFNTVLSYLIHKISCVVCNLHINISIDSIPF